MTTDPKPLSAEEMALARASHIAMGEGYQRLLATIDAKDAEIAALQRDSDELKARVAFELVARDPNARSSAGVAWAYNELTARKAWSKGAVADIIAEQYDRAEAAEAERDALKVERDVLRDFHDAWVEHEISYAVGSPDLLKEKRAAMIARHHAARDALTTKES